LGLLQIKLKRFLSTLEFKTRRGTLDVPLITKAQLSTLIFAPKDLSTSDGVRKFFTVNALKGILGEQGVSDVLDAMLLEIPQAPSAEPQTVMFGHTLGTYAGLSRQQIKDKFGLTDGNVDSIFSALGILE
jgi:hypothetical protein